MASNLSKKKEKSADRRERQIGEFEIIL